jgi:hypothetical protein
MRAGKAKLSEDEDWHGEDVELTFDDPNITRAAFESVVARHYPTRSQSSWQNISI